MVTNLIHVIVYAHSVIFIIGLECRLEWAWGYIQLFSRVIGFYGETGSHQGPRRTAVHSIKHQKQQVLWLPSVCSLEQQRRPACSGANPIRFGDEVRSEIQIWWIFILMFEILINNELLFVYEYAPM